MSLIISPELQAKIDSWRAAAIAGTLSPDAMKEAVLLLRGDRVAAAQATASAKRASKAPRVIPSADDLLHEIGDL